VSVILYLSKVFLCELTATGQRNEQMMIVRELQRTWRKIIRTWIWVSLPGIFHDVLSKNTERSVMITAETAEIRNMYPLNTNQNAYL
jgi:hypothetical protein